MTSGPAPSPAPETIRAITMDDRGRRSTETHMHPMSTAMAGVAEKPGQMRGEQPSDYPQEDRRERGAATRRAEWTPQASPLNTMSSARAASDRSETFCTTGPIAS